MSFMVIGDSPSFLIMIFMISNDDVTRAEVRTGNGFLLGLSRRTLFQFERRFFQSVGQLLNQSITLNSGAMGQTGMHAKQGQAGNQQGEENPFGRVRLGKSRTTIDYAATKGFTRYSVNHPRFIGTTISWSERFREPIGFVSFHLVRHR